MLVTILISYKELFVCVDAAFVVAATVVRKLYPCTDLLLAFSALISLICLGNGVPRLRRGRAERRRPRTGETASDRTRAVHKTKTSGGAMKEENFTRDQDVRHPSFGKPTSSDVAFPTPWLPPAHCTLGQYAISL